MTQPTPTPTPAAPTPAPSPAPQPTPQDPANPPTPAPSNPAPSTPPDEPLGPAGKKALDEERAANKLLREKLGPLADADVGQLVKLAEALGGKQTGETKTDLQLLTDRMSELEKSGANDRVARFRAEVAHEKGLTPEQAARLNGTTREELLADAEALQKLFPTTPRTPAPDPSQGNRGGGTAAADLDARIAEAQGKRDFRTVIALQKQKLNNVPR